MAASVRDERENPSESLDANEKHRVPNLSLVETDRALFEFDSIRRYETKRDETKRNATGRDETREETKRDETGRIET